MAQRRTPNRAQKPSTRLKVKRAEALLTKAPQPEIDVIPATPAGLRQRLMDRMQNKYNDIQGLPPSIIKPSALAPLVHTPKIDVTLSPEKTHTVTLLPDTTISFPSLWIDVFVHGDQYEEAAFAEMFTRAKCSRAASPLECDLMVFTGGADVNPELYGEERYVLSRFDEARDQADIDMYLMCLETGIPMLGICRGAQFLHVMNGGKLYQDVDEHQGAHDMWDCKAKAMVHRVSSVHHQMCRSNFGNGMEVIGTATKSRRRVITKDSFETGQLSDIEAFYYRETNCLGIQGHPEYSGYPAFSRWTLEQIKLYLMADCNPDMEITKGQHKLKPEILAQRPAEIGRTKWLLDYLAARNKEK